MLLGRKDLVQAAWFNGPPNQSFGRAAKISKEQMVGAVVAVEQWLNRDAEVQQHAWHQNLSTIGNALGGLAHVKTQWLEAGAGIPRLKLEWNTEALGLSFEQLQRELLALRPRILLDDYGGSASSVVINPFGLRDGEAELVGTALKHAFERARPQTYVTRTASVDITGQWLTHIQFCNGPATHWFDIHQESSVLSGTHGTPFGQGTLSGHVEGNTFFLDAEHTVEANFVRFRFRGEVSDGRALSGQVLMGAAASHTRGPLTFGQFGDVAWRATRTGS